MIPLNPGILKDSAGTEENWVLNLTITLQEDLKDRKLPNKFVLNVASTKMYNENLRASVSKKLIGEYFY